MPPDRESHPFALYAADMAFLAGVLLAPVFFGLGYVLDALIALVMAVVGAAYSMHRGQPWPGHAVLTYWRRSR
jgi:hypothetical protein